MKFSDVPAVRSCWRSDYSTEYSDRLVFVDFEVVFGVVLGLVILEIRLRSITQTSTYLVDESSVVGPNDGDIRTDYEVKTLGYVVVVDSRGQMDYVQESDRGMSWTVLSGHQVLQQTEAKIQQVNNFD